jgi:hypothetical protein
MKTIENLSRFQSTAPTEADGTKLKGKKTKEKE